MTEAGNPIGMAYPNGKVLSYNYAAGLDDRISRLSSLSDSTGTLEGYAYLGLGYLALLAMFVPQAMTARATIKAHVYLFATVLACCFVALSNHFNHSSTRGPRIGLATFATRCWSAAGSR